MDNNYDNVMNEFVTKYGFVQTDDWAPTGLPIILPLEEDELGKYCRENGYVMLTKQH